MKRLKVLLDRLNKVELISDNAIHAEPKLKKREMQKVYSSFSLYNVDVKHNIKVNDEIQKIESKRKRSEDLIKRIRGMIEKEIPNYQWFKVECKSGIYHVGVDSSDWGG